MLVIRSEQISVLGERPRTGFRGRLAAHCMEAWPEESAALGPSGLDRRIGQALSRASWYGITKELDIVRYLDLMFVWGEPFDEDLEWCRGILGDLGLRPEQKLFMLRERTMESLNGRPGVGG